MLLVLLVPWRCFFYSFRAPSRPLCFPTASSFFKMAKWVHRTQHQEPINPSPIRYSFVGISCLKRRVLTHHFDDALAYQACMSSAPFLRWTLLLVSRDRASSLENALMWPSEPELKIGLWIKVRFSPPNSSSSPSLPKRRHLSSSPKVFFFSFFSFEGLSSAPSG